MFKNKTIIVSVTNDLVVDQRVHKICSFLHENGYKVTLIGRKSPHSLAVSRDYKTKRIYLLFKKGPLFYAFFNLRLFFYLLFHHSDVLLANDLDTLLPNYLVSKIKRKKLIYDSHEYFTEVPELINRPKVQKTWERIEKWIFPKLDTIYTVNQSIAEIYNKKYHKNLFVVRNISKRLDSNRFISKEKLGLPLDQKIIILQGGGINVDRGGEEAVLAMQYIENALLIIIGSGDAIPVLKKLCKEHTLENKIRFIDRKPYEEMMNYTFHADLGLSLDKNTNRNYQFSLPNKIFDYIHAGTPVLASDLVEITHIVKTYKVGEILVDVSPKIIADTINRLFADSAKLEQLKQNCQTTSEELCWENETEVLKQIYEI